jgi:hypothetical protein
MPNFVSRPATIEAVRWDGSNAAEVVSELTGNGNDASLFKVSGGVLYISTPSGVHGAQPGDWIATAGPGDYFPIKPDVFARRWEEATGDGLSFSMALALVKAGKRVARAGWNGKGMFLFLVPGSNFLVNREPLLSILGEGAEVTYRPHIDMLDAEGRVVPWLASQTDLMAVDWFVLPLPRRNEGVE